MAAAMLLWKALPIMPESHLLAGDIGGTKTNLAIFALRDNRLVLQRHARFRSAEFAGLNAILREFLKGHPQPVIAAGFGIPGPVKQGRAKPTNLTWGADAEEISKEFGIPQVALLNDLAANAYGISQLSEKDFAVLQEGNPDAEGNRCVVSPGTGLGEAGLFWNGVRHCVWACEGGHTDFAPRNELEVALFEYLLKRHGHVSYERIVSGMGIENIYDFLRDTGRGSELPEVAKEIKGGNAGAIISRWADSGKCPMCVQTFEIFVSCLGAEVGNMALKSMATGGAFLGGGIPVKILPRLKGASFLHAFTGKGRLSTVLETIPVKVILNDQAALLGAARYALDAAG